MSDNVPQPDPYADFDCPHCGKRYIWAEHEGEIKTVGSLRSLVGLPPLPHVVCRGCGKCCGCLG